MPPLTITTERLVLRPFTETDLPYIADVMRRPEVVRYLYWDVMSPEEARALLERRMQRTTLTRPGDSMVLAVEKRETGQVIGDVMLAWAPSPHRQAEVGYIFHPDVHGKGYASEAVRAMLQYGFDVLGLHRIFGRCDARNTASARLMARLGMRCEARLLENERFKGEWGSELVYAMLEDEWQNRNPGERIPS